MSRAQTKDRVFHTLDALRGVAALTVVSRHEVQYFSPVFFPQSWIAVDIFFVLSGFVLARAYEHRLRTSMSFRQFTLTRIIRLYPLYILGTLLGLLYALASGARLDAMFATNVVLASLMLPNLVGAALFPFDGPAWSLFFELVANFGWAGLIKTSLDRWLPLGVVIAAAGLAAISLVAGHLDVGWQAKTFIGGFPRVAYGFGIGVLMWRYGDRIRLPRLPHWAVLVLAMAMMCAPPPTVFKVAFDLVELIFFVPLLVLLGARTEPGARLAGFYKFLGVTSYGVYTLHMPVGELLRHALAGRGLSLQPVAPWVGVPFLLLLVLLAWSSSKLFDEPVRARLTRRFLTRRPEALPKPLTP